MRDRTWGFRDEVTQWVEYAGLVGIFDGAFVSAMKFLGTDGVASTKVVYESDLISGTGVS